MVGRRWWESHESSHTFAALLPKLAQEEPQGEALDEGNAKEKGNVPMIEVVGDLAVEEIAQRLGATEEQAPGLFGVLALAPEGYPILGVMNFMRIPNDDLLVDGQPVTPLAWLMAGNDPQPIAENIQFIAMVP